MTITLEDIQQAAKENQRPSRKGPSVSSLGIRHVNIDRPVAPVIGHQRPHGPDQLL